MNGGSDGQSYGVKAGGCGADAAGQQEVPWWDTALPSGCKTLLACCMLFIAALVNISAWRLQSGSAYYLPPSFIPLLSHLLLTQPLTLPDI